MCKTDKPAVCMIETHDQLVTLARATAAKPVRDLRLASLWRSKITPVNDPSRGSLFIEQALILARLRAQILLGHKDPAERFFCFVRPQPKILRADPSFRQQLLSRSLQARHRGSRDYLNATRVTPLPTGFGRNTDGNNDAIAHFKHAKSITTE